MIGAASSLGSLKTNWGATWAAPYSRLLIASDQAGWVLDEESKEMIKTAAKLGIDAAMTPAPWPLLRQCVHYTSHFSLASPRIYRSRHLLSVDYFHGKPEQGKDFERVFTMLAKHRDRFRRVRISYSEMRPIVRKAGIEDARIVQIPIGINPDYFEWRNPATRNAVRRRLEIPESAFVVGSFQKDGSGWGDGNEPKWVKGPDVFLRAIEILAREIPNLIVLLTGPARGFVKQGLEKLGVPYRHAHFERYPEVAPFYQALDVYLVASREEGGPKSILESMISGIPIVSTRVGQAIDLVRDGENGFLADVEDAEALAKKVLRVAGDEALRERMLKAGLATAQTQTYSAQLPAWREFFRGYVEPISLGRN